MKLKVKTSNIGLSTPPASRNRYIAIGRPNHGKIFAGLACTFALGFLTGCSPTLKDPVIEEAANALQSSHINTRKADWNRIRLVISLPPYAFNRKRAIQYMIDSLQEKHTFYFSAAQAQETFKNANVIRKQVEAIRGFSIGSTAVVEVPAFFGGVENKSEDYSRSLFDTVSRLAESQPERWVIDLRGSGGGNMYPMLSGLACFFDGDVLGYFLNAYEHRIAWRVKFNAAGTESEGRWLAHANVAGKCAEGLSTKPLIVLIDGGTGSSSEAVAISLLSMERTKVFGQRTAGFATGNFPLPLSDGSLLLVTASQMLDRNGKDFPKGIDPVDYPSRGEVVPRGADILDFALQREVDR